MTSFHVSIDHFLVSVITDSRLIRTSEHALSALCKFYCLRLESRPTFPNYTIYLWTTVCSDTSEGSNQIENKRNSEGLEIKMDDSEFNASTSAFSQEFYFL